MVALLCFLLTLLASPFKSKNRLEAENAVLRHQLIVLHRKVRGRVQFTNSDRLLHPAVSWATSEPTSLRVRQPQRSCPFVGYRCIFERHRSAAWPSAITEHSAITADARAIGLVK